MKKFILIGATTLALANARAQDAASTPVPSPDVENLRQQMQALTETVKTLQQQVKDQQKTIDQFSNHNGAAPETEESPATGAASPAPSASPAAKGTTQFPTEDTSVVSSTTNAPAAASPGVNANGTAVGNFPTTDSSVVSSAPETISST